MLALMQLTDCIMVLRTGSYFTMVTQENSDGPETLIAIKLINKPANKSSHFRTLPDFRKLAKVISRSYLRTFVVAGSCMKMMDFEMIAV
jgi:hypothetical protein